MPISYSVSEVASILAGSVSMSDSESAFQLLVRTVTTSSASCCLDGSCIIQKPLMI